MKKIDEIEKLLKAEKQKTDFLEKELLNKKKEIEEILSNSAYETYKTVIESASDIIFKTDIKGYFTYVNPSAEISVGYTKDELIGMHFLSIIKDDFKDEIVATYLNQLNSKKTTSYYEFPVVRKDGIIIWVGQNVQPILVNGNVAGFTAIARDISERKKSQEQLKIMNIRLESIFNNTISGQLFEDNDRKVIMVNEKFCEIFHYKLKSNDLLGLDYNDRVENSIIYFLNGQQHLEKINKCLKEKVSVFSQEVLLADGRILEYDYIPIFIDKKYTGHLWKYRDITEKVNARKILLQNEEKYRLIIQNMNLGLLVVDIDEIIIDCNPSFTDMVGFSRNELIGKSASEIFLPVEKTQIFEDVVDLRKKGVSNAYELEVKDKNGEIKWMLISGSPVFDAQNKVSGSIGIHLDITDRKQQMIDLNEARQKAEQSASSKEIFLANMSHEIRTPMNAIVGMARLLDEIDLPTKGKDYLNAIKISSENLLVIINDILDFSKIGLDKMTLEENVFAFHSVIKNTALQFEIKTIEKNLFFSIHIDSKINEFFKADSGRLVQVLNNLLANAIKFTKKGGVDLICKLIEDSVDKQVVQFIVKDTGIGIDEDKQETVFESFMQENSSINRKYGGTGLGLSISKQLVNLFGSELKVVSEKGVGSTFSFQIQLKKENYGLTDLPIEKNIDTTELNSKNVLLVEDNKVNQFLAITILEQFGMVVTVANNGSEAIEFLINDPYDIILMDLQMPGIDGIAATKMIRNKLKITTPIIALTANAIIGDREKCLDAGMNDYISKPFNKNELALKIIKLLKNDSVVKEAGQKELNAVVPGFSLDKLKDISPENDDFVKSMVELFCELVTETIDNIDTAVAAKNYSAIKNYAHKIKSSIDMLEIKDLIGKVREIEKAENFLDDSFFKKINYFKDSLRQVQTMLKKMDL